MTDRTRTRRWLPAVGAVAVLAAGATWASSFEGWIVRDEDGCPSSRHLLQRGVVDWVDVVGFEGGVYESFWFSTELPTDRLGAKVGEVRCTYGEDVAVGDYLPRDGEATFAPVGTPLHEVTGVPTTFEIAVPTAGGARVLRRAVRFDDPATGADLFPPQAVEVTGVAFVAGEEGLTERGRVPDAELAATVAALRAAPVLDDLEPDVLLVGPIVYLRLERGELPPVELAVYVNTGVTSDGLVVPGDLVTQLRPFIEQ